MKMSQYNRYYLIDEVLYVVNTKNLKYVVIDQEEEIQLVSSMINDKNLDKSSNIVNQLYNQGYIVDDDCDEYSEIKKVLDDARLKRDSIIELQFYTTDNCNFRCKYCAEKHLPNSISEENWNLICKHIENGFKNEVYKTVKLTFFGGEPLLEYNKVKDFLQKVNNVIDTYNGEKGFWYMVTNGYLLSPEIYDNLSSLGINRFDVTLDGFADNHNKTRPLVNNGETWEKIVDNLKYVSSKKDGARILLRTNINPDLNEEYLNKFYAWVKETFDTEKFTFDINPVNDSAPDEAKQYVLNVDDKTNAEMIERLIHNNLNKSIKSVNSMLRYESLVCDTAKNRNYYSVLSNGEITKCGSWDASLPKLKVGKINKDGNIEFYENINEWLSNFEHEECETCPIYPQCVGRHCPLRKVYSSTDREDCNIAQQDFDKNLAYALKNGNVTIRNASNK